MSTLVNCMGRARRAGVPTLAIALLGCGDSGEGRGGQDGGRDGQATDGAPEGDGSAGGDASAPTMCEPVEPGPGDFVVGEGDFATVGEAVAAAEPGGRVVVRAGVYAEQVEVDRAITLTGAGDGAAWIDAECERENGVHVSASGATVRCMGVRQTRAAGVLIDSGASDVTVEGMTIQDFECEGTKADQFRAGIGAWYAGSGLRLLDNVITRRVDLPGTQQGGGDAIWFKSNDEKPSGGGHVIARNVITGGRDGIGGEEEGSVYGSFDRDTLIEGNTVRDCADDGIQVEGGDVDVVVRGNLVERCGVGIAFAANLVGPLTIEDNVILDDDPQPGVYGQSACYKLGAGGEGTTYLTGNECRITAMDPETGEGGDGFQQTNDGLSPVVSRRNIVQVGRYVIEFRDTPPAGTSFDEDCLFTTDPERFVKWSDIRYPDLASFRKATGQEPNGQKTADCSFLDR